MFRFDIKSHQGHQAQIRVYSLDWSEAGDVELSCNDDQLAMLLLSQPRCDGHGFFNLLAGCKPMWVEQWLEYLHESKRLASVKVQLPNLEIEPLCHDWQLNHEQQQQLLQLLFALGGFNRLQIQRYLKHRNNPAYLATRYSNDDLQRYRLLNEALQLLAKHKSNAS